MKFLGVFQELSRGGWAQYPKISVQLSLPNSLFILISISLSICLVLLFSFFLSHCLCLSLSLYLSLSPSLCLSLPLSLYLCLCLFFFLSLSLSMSPSPIFTSTVDVSSLPPLFCYFLRLPQFLDYTKLDDAIVIVSFILSTSLISSILITPPL